MSAATRDLVALYARRREQRIARMLETGRQLARALALSMPGEMTPGEVALALDLSLEEVAEAEASGLAKLRSALKEAA